MNITRLNAHSRSVILNEMLDAMKSVAEEHGLSIVSTKSPGYDASGRYFEPTFRVSVLNENGEAYDPMKTEFEHLAKSYGLEPSDYGKEFKIQVGRHKWERYRITGLKTSRPKYPIQGIRVSDGRGFKFPSNTVAEALRRETIIADKKERNEVRENAFDGSW